MLQNSLQQLLWRAGCYVGRGKTSDCQRNTAKKMNRHSSHTASFTPKHRMLMLELPVLNSGVSQSWWKVSCFLNHSAGDMIICCWCRHVSLLCSVSQAFTQANSCETLFFSIVQEQKRRGEKQKGKQAATAFPTHVFTQDRPKTCVMVQRNATDR